jgi:carbamoyl-phosphate synthase large subunit
MVVNTVEEKRSAITDSRTIRTSALQARVVTYTTIAGAEAAIQGMRYLDELRVYDLQGLHKALN